MLHNADQLKVGDPVGVCPAYNGHNQLWKKHNVLKVTKTQITLSNDIRYLRRTGVLLGSSNSWHTDCLMSIEDTDKHNDQVKDIVAREQARQRLEGIVGAFKFGHISTEQLLPHLVALEAMIPAK